MGWIDILVFVGFVAAVIGIGLWKSRGEETHSENGAQNYFLAGRGLTWWLVGFSLIAANISTEQFVGMSGEAANWLGMAIASYEWMAAVTLVLVAFIFLPQFLKSGIYTIPEFLEYRYDAFARTVMAIFSLVILVGVPTVTVIYSGAKVIAGNFQGLELFGKDLGNITLGCWLIGTLGAIYVFVGGLKACVWADLIQGSALVIGGAIIAWYAFDVLRDADPAELVQSARDPAVTVEEIETAGAWERFWKLNDAPLPEGKLHMKRPIDDMKIPWTALALGLWIPNFFYWGLNQYITQRSLGSKSLAEGQKGIVFAAFLKLLIPFVVVIPGILAFNLFNGDLLDDAVNRNAQVISMKSPAAYQRLTDGMTPDSTVKRNESLIAEIEENLAKAPVDAKPVIYKFEKTFAELHSRNASATVAYNLEIVGDQLDLTAPGDQASPEELAAFSQKLADAVEENAADKKLLDNISVETLIGHDYDNAFPTLIRELLPENKAVKGFVLAALFGAVVSSLASMLNSASTIATMDLYRKLSPNATGKQLVRMGRFFVALFVLIAMSLAPMLANPEFGGIFHYVQEFQGFLSPGVLAVFLFGLLVHRAPRACGKTGLILSPILFTLFKFADKIPGASVIPGLVEPLAKDFKAVVDWSFLDRMSLTFLIVLGVLTAMTLVRPLKQPVDLPVNPEMNVENSKPAMFLGGIVILLTLVLYAIFW